MNERTTNNYNQLSSVFLFILNAFSKCQVKTSLQLCTGRVAFLLKKKNIVRTTDEQFEATAFKRRYYFTLVGFNGAVLVLFTFKLYVCNSLSPVVACSHLSTPIYQSSIITKWINYLVPYKMTFSNKQIEMHEKRVLSVFVALIEEKKIENSWNRCNSFKYSSSARVFSL